MVRIVANERMHALRGQLALSSGELLPHGEQPGVARSSFLYVILFLKRLYKSGFLLKPPNF